MTSSKPVVLLGGGAHVVLLMDLLGILGRRILGVLDPAPDRERLRRLNLNYLGSDDHLRQLKAEDVDLANAIGSSSEPVARRETFERGRAAGFEFLTLVHPSAVIAATVTLGQGVHIMAGAVIQPFARIDDNALINTRASVDHDCVIGKHAHIAPGVTLSGRVTIGDNCHIGTGASVIQGITIGTRATIGAGAVVIRNVAAGQKVAGVPAREL